MQALFDFHALNERETHLLPTVDETLAHLNGTTIFSKVDANCGLCLTEKYQHLTTLWEILLP